MIASAISDTLSKVKDKIDPVQAHLLLSDIYANTVGIFDLSQREKRPLHSVAMHDAEENGINSLFFDSLKLYQDNKVFQNFGLSWNEMKKLTHEEFNYIMELAAIQTSAENEKNKNSLKELQDGLITKK